MSRSKSSQDSMAEATKSRARFSGHGNSKGAAGYRTEGDGSEGEFLSGPGETAIINPQEGGFDTIRIGAAWDNIPVQQSGFLERLLKKTMHKGVDLDLGCLYELQNGQRGAIQAFGDLYGTYDEEPFIKLSGDERTGDAEGDDEYIFINGQHWPDIKRLLVYVYIYDGAPDWRSIKPQIHVNVPGETPLIVKPQMERSELNVCVIAGLENVRNGIKLSHYTEYYPGHAEMDRAFGYGLQWDDGEKAG